MDNSTEIRALLPAAARPRKRQSGIVAFLAVALALGLLTYGALYTKTGVDVMFTLFAPDQSISDLNPDGPPIQPTIDLVRADTRSLPLAILQPSGIAWDPADERFLVATDQAELFELPPSLDAIKSSTVINGAPLLLRQGQIETVAVSGERAFIAGDYDEVAVWSKGSDGWQTELGLPLGIDGLPTVGEIAAMSVDPETGTLVLSDEGQGLLLSLQDGTSLRLQLTGDLRAGRSVSEYQIVGLHHGGDNIVALAAGWNDLLNIDPVTGEISTVYSLVDAGEVSGIALRKYQAFVTIDHEYSEAPPGVAVYLLPPD